MLGFDLTTVLKSNIVIFHVELFSYSQALKIPLKWPWKLNVAFTYKTFYAKTITYLMSIIMAVCA